MVLIWLVDIEDALPKLFSSASRRLVLRVGTYYVSLKFLGSGILFNSFEDQTSTSSSTSDSNIIEKGLKQSQKDLSNIEETTSKNARLVTGPTFVSRKRVLLKRNHWTQMQGLSKKDQQFRGKRLGEREKHQ